MRMPEGQPEFSAWAVICFPFLTGVIYHMSPQQSYLHILNTCDVPTTVLGARKEEVHLENKKRWVGQNAIMFFFCKIKDIFFIFTNNFIDLDILSMSAIALYVV